MRKTIAAIDGLKLSINVKENVLVTAGADRRGMTFCLRKSMTDTLRKNLRILLVTAHNSK